MHYTPKSKPITKITNEYMQLQVQGVHYGSCVLYIAQWQSKLCICPQTPIVPGMLNNGWSFLT